VAEKPAITLSAFRWVPPFAQGLVRDLRVRWALEEAGLPYEERLLDLKEKNGADYRSWQPFGQVPAFEEGDLAMFESGAIVLHVAEQSSALMPADSNEQARVRTWLFAALNSVEPPIQNLTEIDLFNADQPWAKERRPAVLKRAQQSLGELAAALGNAQYLVADRFSAADLMMTTVLRIPRQTDLVAQFPALDAYRLRCEARPAFKKALADQLRPFAANAPAPARAP
jgi:glutathione S-transferase